LTMVVGIGTSVVRPTSSLSVMNTDPFRIFQLGLICFLPPARSSLSVPGTNIFFGEGDIIFEHVDLVTAFSFNLLKTEAPSRYEKFNVSLGQRGPRS
jgi:hypothetical protein